MAQLVKWNKTISPIFSTANVSYHALQGFTIAAIQARVYNKPHTKAYTTTYCLSKMSRKVVNRLTTEMA